MSLQTVKGVRVVVEGCGHGTLNSIYASIQKACQIKGWNGVDLVIIGGDFQAVRNAADLTCMAVPVKYREIGDFHEYYAGARKAPYLTLFVGGNHEASNHLWELYYGGWVAPNIYYMGAANVLRVGPLRIAGLSGIWKGYNYRKPHFERLPYNQDDVRSIYHVRELDTRKLLQIRTQVDVGVSHDWPRGVEWLGDYKYLFRKKDLFEKDAREGNLGSVAAKLALDHLKPAYWFSAHLHIKYAAIVHHAENDKLQHSAASDSKEAGVNLNGTTDHSEPPVVHNEEEINLDMEDEPAPGPESICTPKTAANQASKHNNDEIVLDIDDDEEPNDLVQGTSNQSQKSTENNSLTEVTSEGKPADDSYIPATIRAQLPDSFTRPARGPIFPDPPTAIHNKTTHFLALDKCLPRRNFLQLLTIDPISAPPPDPSPTTQPQSQPQHHLQPEPETGTKPKTPHCPLKLYYDPEFLAITRALHTELHVAPHPAATSSTTTTSTNPAHNTSYTPKLEAAAAWVDTHITRAGKLEVPLNFTHTAPVHDASSSSASAAGGGVAGAGVVLREYSNPQTAAFCALLGIENVFEASEEERGRWMREGPRGGGGGFGGRGNSGRRGRGGGRGAGGGRGRGYGRGGRW